MQNLSKSMYLDVTSKMKSKSLSRAYHRERFHLDAKLRHYFPNQTWS